MSWRNELRPGKFRDAEFQIRDANQEGGRRNALHEYPLRDIPYTEDLGRKARQFSLECVVLGRYYMAARDALIDALEQPGPGTLSHPYRGHLQVIVSDYTVTESTQEGGVAAFAITFREAGDNLFPVVSKDTAAVVDMAADSALAAIQEDFAAVFSVAQQAEYFVTAAQTVVTEALASITDTVGDLTSAIGAVVRAPANLAATVVGAITNISALVRQPIEAFNLYKDLFDAGGGSPPVPQTTANRQRQAANQEAAQQLVRRAAIVEACRTSTALAFASGNEAVALRDTLADALDAQMEAVSVVTGQPVPDAVFAALADLRAAVMRDISARGADLARLVTYTPKTTLPALVLAYQLYDDPTQDAEIVARNRIRRPGFVTGGYPLEVLTDA